MSRHKALHSFTSSSAKDYIRAKIDYNIIKHFRQTYYPDQKLAYFGLPGAQLLDVLCWREYIGYCTAVENTNAADELERTILKHHLEHIVHLIRQDIDDLICTDTNHSRLHWPYQIVNLDYYGGLINIKAGRTSKRLETLKKLFRQQVGIAFILFVTLNLRDKDAGELDDLVKLHEEDLLGLDIEGVKECFDKHRELNHAGLLKIYVPIFLESIARQHTLTFIPPILYHGTQQMIHFAVQCVPYTELAAGRVSTIRERINLINLPLLFLHSYDDLQSIKLGRITINGSLDVLQA